MASTRGKASAWSCIFCQGEQNSKASNEHVWPAWSKQYFRRTAHDARVEHKTEYRGKSLTQTAPTVSNLRHGHVSTSKLKVVCQRCNNGWMSAEEDRAKPLLQLLVEGRFLAISPKDMEALATWVALKFMVVDQKDPAESAITQDDRSRMYRTQSPPAGLKVWIFQTKSDHFDATFYQHSMGLAWGTPDVRPQGKNVKSLTFGFGELMVYAVYMQDPTLYDAIKIVFTGGDIPIWPITRRGAIWPPSRPTTDFEAWDISGTLRKVWMSPGTSWAGE